MPPSTRPKKRPKQDYMKRADRLFSKLIRARDGHCQAVGTHDITCSGYLQCAHIVGRGELSLRVDESNALTLCQAHHVFFTHRPAAWHDFIDDHYPGRWDELRAKAREHRGSGLRVDWRAEVGRLKGDQ